LGPAFEVDVGGDRDRALFVRGGDEAEQVIGGDAIQRGEAKIIDHDEVVAQQPSDQLADGVVGEAAVERSISWSAPKKRTLWPAVIAARPSAWARWLLPTPGGPSGAHAAIAAEARPTGEPPRRQPRHHGCVAAVQAPRRHRLQPVGSI
jgi:hypothetical protein